MFHENLKTIEKIVNGKLNNETFQNITINGVSTDTRNIDTSNLFIPLIGENFDAHNFIEDVIVENKAKAILAKENSDIENYNYPIIFVEDTLKALQDLATYYGEKVNPITIGITGSNGKTSTKDILASILKEKGKTHFTKGNLNNHIGVPLTILEMPEDTEYAVIEMGISNFGEMELLSKIIRPDIGLITNAAESHLDELINKENVAKAKMEFIPNLKDEGIYIYYGDDKNLKKLAPTKNLNVYSYGEANFNDFIIEDIYVDSFGSRFKIENISSDFFEVPLIGSHQVFNGTAAISIAHLLNVDEDSIKRGLREVKLTGMRNELKKGSNFTILDDSYKSNPSSLKAALDTIYSFEGFNRKILVLGDMLGLGEPSEKMHRDIGRNIDFKEIDYIIGIGEATKFLVDEASKNFSNEKLFYFKEKSNDVVSLIESLIEEETLILVKASRALELDTIVKELLDE